MEPTPEEIADVLDKAHDELMLRGHHKGYLFDFNGGPGVCAVGAIRCAVWGSAFTRNEVNHVLDQAVCAFRREVIRRGGAACITRWNDEPERTIDDVLDAFRHTSKSLREQAGAA